MSQFGKNFRAVYAALSISYLLGILSDELLENTLDFIISCQTYEGGFAGLPDCEAHGGYTFCGLASLQIIHQYYSSSMNPRNHITCKLVSSINWKNMVRWIHDRQDKVVGGFQGRTNKLADSCYSFWLGGTIPIILDYFLPFIRPSLDRDLVFNDLFDCMKLKSYLLDACQDLSHERSGGFRDKPGKQPDFYHTCSSLTGLCMLNRYLNENDKIPNLPLLHLPLSIPSIYIESMLLYFQKKYAN